MSENARLLQGPVRRGRRLLVNGSEWIWRIGRGGGVVAYGQNGQRKYARASDIKGCDPDTFDRGKHKRTSDGMLTPKDVAAWVSLPNRPDEGRPSKTSTPTQNETNS